jgi:hypothetical protein
MVNQMLPQQNQTNTQGCRDYLTKIRSTQAIHLASLTSFCDSYGIPVHNVPYFDTEVQTVYGLRMISSALK